MIQRGFTTSGTGEKLTPFPECGGSGSGTDTDDQPAAEVPYDNSGSGLTADDVQEAIDELAAQVAACCDSVAGGQFSSGDLLSTGEFEEVSGAGKQDQIWPDFVTPVNGDFAWINQGGASVTVNANGGIHLIAPANSGISMRIRKKSAPSTPYVITACFNFDLMNFNFQQAGLLWRQSSDGKLVTMCLQQQGAGNLIIKGQDLSNPTTFSADNNGQGCDTLGAHLWLQIEDNGTNRITRWSTNGYNFIELQSEGRTTFATGDEVGFFAMDSSNSKQAACTLLSWEET